LYPSRVILLTIVPRAFVTRHWP